MKALEEKPMKVAKEVQQLKEADTHKDEPTPTAMEAALREAMERSKAKQDTEPEVKSKRKPSKNDEIEKILSRTLQHKVRTSK
jgi:hypothetical protein